MHEIGFLIFDGVKMLDVAGPSEVFTEANLHGTSYRISMLTVDGEDARASIGVPLAASASAFDERRWDTVIVAGGTSLAQARVPSRLSAAARHLAARADRVASVCTGAFILGAAGLLAGKRATTHWKYSVELARQYPDTQVDPDRIFVRDGDTYTSAGVTAGIDLALALLEDDHGSDLARRIARCLVVYMQRPGGQSQFSAALEGDRPRTPALREVTDHVRADPRSTYSVETLARIAHLSPRHLTRLFREELDITPGKFVEGIRFELAKAQLDGGTSVTMAAELSGFGSSESLRRAFIAHLGIPPLQYQRRFRTTQIDRLSA
jgi:transcriptional regulator GlxA family with amidase domain